MAPIRLVTPIRLVSLGTAHRSSLLETMRDPEVLRFTRTPDPMPAGWIDDWLARFDGIERAAWAILDEHDVFLGYAVTGPIDREGSELELGYAVAPAARGRGVASGALLAMTLWAFAQGMQRVVALISTDNPASSRVAEKAGFSFEGVLRSVHHVGGRRGDLQSWSILPGELPALPIPGVPDARVVPGPAAP